MKRFVQGHRAFMEHMQAHDPELFKQLALGQQPEALVVTCSDSRISPSVLMGAELGSLFAIRNAGNIVPKYQGVPGAEATGEGATVEFAVRHLKVRDIIVVGHSECGAMKGLMSPEGASQMPLVQQWLRHAQVARARVHAHYPELEGSAQLCCAAHENVKLQLEHLRSYPAVREALAQGNLRLHGWYFDIEQATMFVYDVRRDAFVALLEQEGKEAVQAAL